MLKQRSVRKERRARAEGGREGGRDQNIVGGKSDVLDDEWEWMGE